MYQAIYRKYRPRTFADVFGQSHITDTLLNQLKTGRVSHAYLFTGTRGTGKTTCAKLLARAVNCQNLINGDPCGVCPACVSILNGAAVDVTELDAASNTGVDNMRSILEEVVYAPSELTKRVYIIDEVHMLSIGAFNALLKTLEEPPPHVLFILATTELHKVPATILSRCQRFDFRRVSPKEIAANISHIADKEGISLSGGAIGLISRLADGSVRDSLSILERCVAQESGSIDEETVLACVGGAQSDSLGALATAVAAYDAAGALTQIDTLYRSGRDLRSVFDALCTLMRDVLIVKTLSSGWDAFVSPGADEGTLTSLAKLLTPGRLTSVIHTLSDTMNRMQRSGANRTEAELAVIALSTPPTTAEASAAGNEELLARLAAMEQRLAAGIPTVPAVTPAEPVQKEAPKAEKTENKPKPTPETPTPAQTGTVLSPSELKAFLDKLKPSLSRSAHVTLGMATISKKGDKLRIVVDDDLSQRVLKDHAVITLLTDASAALFGTTAPAEVLTEAAAGSSDGEKNGFDLLMELGKASGIDVTIR